MKRVFTILIFLVCATVLLAQPSKPLHVYEADGIKVRSFDYNGLEPLLTQNNDTIYVVNFWATWCLPCIAELPAFEKVQSTAKGQKLKVLLVSLDIAKQVPTKLIPYIRKKKIAAEVVHLHDPDANSWIAKVGADWSGAIPATIIYRGTKRKFYERSFTFDELQNEIALFK